VKISSLNRSALCIACVSLISACSSITNADKVNYKTQGTAKVTPLDIPPDLTQLAKDTRYAVPSGTVTASSMANKVESKAPTTAPKQINDVRLERDGKQRWLVVNRSAESVWPVVHQFWEDNGFEYVIDQQPLGILETEWAENRAKIPQDFIRSTIGKVLDGLYSSGERDKFRTRIERNESNGVDIFITHRGMSEEYKDQTKTSTIWSPRPSDPELEAEFLSRLMVKLGVSENDAKSTLTNAVQAPPARAKLLSNASLITSEDSFDVTWRRVGVSLDRTGFTVEDRDRAQGVYFVRYIDTTPKEEKGFFSRMFSSEKPDSGPLKYRILVKGLNGQSEISILNSAGVPENSAISQRIAKILADDLK
jgi:outer membrane protein assembly factor BamC